MSNMRPVPKPKSWRSDAYLAFVREHPCLFCGAGSVVHHVRELSSEKVCGGVGIKEVGI